MIKDLTFSPSPSGQYEATFISLGPSTVQLTLSKPSTVRVLANVHGMPPCLMGMFPISSVTSLLFTADFVAGTEVTVSSSSPVTEAKILNDV